MPTGQDGTERAAYINPNFEITATHRHTKEIRQARVECRIDPVSQSAAWSRAPEGLGIWAAGARGKAGPNWSSRRKRQGWPLFTQQIIPRLYDYLAPYYKVKGHHSERPDEPKLSLPALLPTELLQDMLDILRLEHPHEFADATLPQLKAVIQRHLAKAGARRRQELSPRSPRKSRT